MAAKPLSTTDKSVTLLRPGAETLRLDLPEGATLADLLRVAGVDVSGRQVYVGETPAEELVVLAPGAIVKLIPRPRNACVEDNWREGVGMLRDDPGFRDVLAAAEARRRNDEDTE